MSVLQTSVHTLQYYIYCILYNDQREGRVAEKTARLDTLTCLLSRRSGSLTTAAPHSSTIHSISSTKNTHKHWLQMCTVLRSNCLTKYPWLHLNVILSAFTPLTQGDTEQTHSKLRLPPNGGFPLNQCASSLNEPICISLIFQHIRHRAFNKVKINSVSCLQHENSEENN